VVVKLVPVPLAGDPPVAVHANAKGAVPPVAEAVQLTAMLTVPVGGQFIVSVSAVELIVIVAELVAVFAFASVTVMATVSVPGVVKVVENVEDVAVALVAPFTDQAYL
jgi:hypothetical protein